MTFKSIASAVFTIGVALASGFSGARADDTLSTAVNGDATLQSPASALNYFDGLSQASTAPAADARIDALARALKYDPDLIYEHVRNHVEFTPTFGLTKGAVGAIVDEAGTAFDQAQLMVELLRVVNPATGQATTAKYKLGQLTLNGTEFDEWFGITNAKAACNVLADGGIPATVNGSTNCAGLSGNVSTVVMTHIWVEATIPGLGTFVFDPARKVYKQIGGVGLSTLKSQMGFSSSTFNSTASASTGTINSVPWASNINYTSIENYLGARANSLITYLKNNHPDASLEEIIGGRIITPWRGAPLRLSAVPNQTGVNKTWLGDLPDVYRTKVTIYVHGCGDGQTSNCPNFTYNTYADQLAGKRVALGSMEVGTGSAGEGQADVHLFIDGASVASIARPLVQLDPVCDTNQGGIGKFIPAGGAVDIKITVNAPYAASSGAYMDRVYDTLADLDEPAALVLDFGDRRAGKGHDTPSEQIREWVYPYLPAQFYFNWDNINPATFPGSFLPRVGSDKQRFTIVKSYLDQSAQLRRVADGLFSGRSQHHYSIGIAWSRTQTGDVHRGDLGLPTPHPCQPQVYDAATSLDVVSGISSNTLNGDADDSKRLSHIIISSSAMLEGSVGEQATDSPVVLNTQSRFKWASEHLSGEKFYLVTAANYAAAAPLVADEAYAQPYTNAGYSVLLPASTGLGPGPSVGVKYFTNCSTPGGGCIATYRPSNYKGGALIAFDTATGSGAYMVQAGAGGFNGTKWLKGGGATEEYDDFDPTKLPDVMEEDYGLRAGLVDGVSLANGQLTYQPAPDIVTGSGSFPYSLAFQRKFKAGPSRSRALQRGWTHNFDLQAKFGGDGMEALGVTSPQHAAAAISALIAADSILDATWDARRLLALTIIQNWQREKMANNTVTLTQGNDSIQFYRLANGTFSPPPGQTGTLTQSGSRTFYVPGGNAACPVDPVAAGGTGNWGGVNWSSLTNDNKVGSWWYGNITLTYISAMGDKQTYSHYTWHGTPFGAFHASAVNRCNTGHHATSWVFPQGVTLTFNYSSGAQGDANRGRLTSVSNGIGRTLSFSGGTGSGNTGDYVITASDGRSVTVSSTQTTRPDGTVMNYEYDNTGSLFYQSSADWSAARPMPWPQLTKVYAASDAVNPHLTIDYDEMWRVKSITDKNNSSWNFHIAGSRGSVVDPLGHETASYFDEDGREIRSVSALGDVTEKLYSGIGLVEEERQYFVGGICTDASEYDAKTTTDEYDTKWWRPIQQSQHPAECVNASPTASQLITTLTEFLPDYPLPRKETDALGTNTWYDYAISTHGGATTKLLGVISHPAGDRTEIFYGAAGKGRPTQKRVRIATGPGVWETTDYGYTGEHFTSRTIDPGGINAVTSFQYDAAGNADTVTDPNGNVTTIAWDNMRRLTQLTQPLGAITQLKYDADGKVTKSCAAIAASPGDCNASPGNFTVTSYAYTPTFKVGQVTDPDGEITNYQYNLRDELYRVTDAEGRIEQTDYDAAGQVIRIHKAVGTSLEQIYREAGYNGASQQLAWVKDANGNKTEYSYDEFGRLQKTCFPDKVTTGAVSTSDCETATYDKNGNVLAKVTRRGYNNGGTPTEQIDFVYDTRNRLTQRTVPGSWVSAGHDNFVFTYDQAGRMKTSYQLNNMQSFDYDAAGRLKSVNHNGTTTQTSVPDLAITYDYDAAGNLTHISHHDGFVVRYTYDALNRVERVRQVNAPSDSGYLRQFAHITYDRLSRRMYKGLAPDNGFNTAARYSYTARGDLICHDWNFTGTRPTSCNTGSPEVAYDFTYNGVGQMLTQQVSDSLLYWSPTNNESDSYTPNGLNQYTTIDPSTGAPVSPVYDGNGNVTTDHLGRTLDYSAENVLVKISDGSGDIGTYAYYASNGMRRYKSAGGNATLYYQHGDQDIIETDWAGSGTYASQTVLRRYIRLPGSVDEPLLMIDYTLDAGCTVTSAANCERYAHQNYLGSVIAVTDANGAVTERHTYSPYGEVGGSTSGFPFRFTGQRIDTESGLYYYKARYYDSEIGRFLQTDPIGYEDQMNLYAYCGNDAINCTDPTGREIYTADLKALAGIAGGGKLSLSFSFDTANFQSEVTLKGGAGEVVGAFAGAGGKVSPSDSNPQPAVTDVVGKVTASADVSVGYWVAVSGEVSSDLYTASLNDGPSGPSEITAEPSLGGGMGAAISNTVDVSISYKSTIVRDILGMVGIKSKADKQANPTNPDLGLSSSAGGLAPSSNSNKHKCLACNNTSADWWFEEN